MGWGGVVAAQQRCARNAMQARGHGHRQLDGPVMEAWVNTVLTGPATAGAVMLPGNQQRLVAAGLAKHGLGRAELHAAGMAGPEVDRMYRSMYVYSMGFFDTMQVSSGSSGGGSGASQAAFKRIMQRQATC